MQGVCSLDALAAGTGLDGDYLVATDARRREVYWARYRGSPGAVPHRLDGPAVGAAIAVARAGLPVAGRGAALHPEELGEALPPLEPSAAGIAAVALASHRGAGTGPALPAPPGRRDSRPAQARPGSVSGGPAALRRMRWWDIETVLPLEAELFASAAWSAETFWSELAQPATRCYLVAEERGALLGYAGVLLGGAEADVQTLAVAPAAQRRGIGSVLLAGLLRAAAGSGAGAVLLEVRADNAAAIALYARHGFEQIAVRRRYYQPGDVDALVLRLRPLRAG